MLNAIRGICGGYGRYCLVGGNLQNILAKIHFNLTIPQNEEIIAFIDCTTFSSAKYGLAVCSSGIYWKNDSTQDSRNNYLPYCDFKEAAFASNGMFAVGFGNGNILGTSSMMMRKNDLIALLNEIKRLAIENPNSFPEQKTPATASVSNPYEEPGGGTSIDSSLSAYHPNVYRSSTPPRYAMNNRKESFHPMYQMEVSDCIPTYETVGLNENGQIVLDPWDMALRRIAKAKHFSLTMEKLYSGDNDFDSDIELGVFVTDSRIIFYSPTYKNKGSTWFGWGVVGIAAAAVATVGSKTAAAIGNRGKVSLGHMRYEWISSIGYISKPKRGGFFDVEMQYVNMTYTDSKRHPYTIEVWLSEGENARDIANDMLHRISSYRLAMADVKDQQAMAFWSYYSNIDSVIPPAGREDKYSVLRLPPAYFPPNGEDVRPYV